MDTISLREFQLHAGNYLDKLPIFLTRYGKVICSVQSNTMVYGDGKTPKLVLPEDLVDVAVPKVALGNKKEPHFTNHPTPGYHLSAALGKYVKDVV